jgi:hypothetical protein
VARRLQAAGFQAAALGGGYLAWRARFPVEPKRREPLGAVTPGADDQPRTEHA